MFYNNFWQDGIDKHLGLRSGHYSFTKEKLSVQQPLEVQNYETNQERFIDITKGRPLMNIPFLIPQYHLKYNQF